MRLERINEIVCGVITIILLMLFVFVLGVRVGVDSVNCGAEDMYVNFNGDCVHLDEIREN